MRPTMFLFLSVVWLAAGVTTFFTDPSAIGHFTSLVFGVASGINFGSWVWSR